MDFSETLEVKVVDKADNFAIDSYFFAYFPDLPAALEQIRDAVRTYRTTHSQDNGNGLAVLDTTVTRSPMPLERIANPQSAPVESPIKTTSGFRLSSIFRPFSDSTPRGASVPAISDLQNDDYTHVSRKENSASFIPVTSSPEPIHAPANQDLVTSPPLHSTRSLPQPEHTYPPSTSSSTIYPNHSSLNRESSSSWGVGVPSWLKTPRKVFGVSTVTDTNSTVSPSPVKEVYSSVSSRGPPSRTSGYGDLAFSVLETPEMLPDQEATDKFRSAFAYDEKETLLGCKLSHRYLGKAELILISDFPGYIYRLLPVFGKLYISTNFFCFKSSGPLAARTRVCRFQPICAPLFNDFRR